ncbi:MAG: hypothetical protein L3J52_08295, partial [Proteobacteria bacterium]|nr:hypothetical protein [Pseudomonadota bacterium]
MYKKFASISLKIIFFISGFLYTLIISNQQLKHKLIQPSGETQSLTGRIKNLPKTTDKKASFIFQIEDSMQ